MTPLRLSASRSPCFPAPLSPHDDARGHPANERARILIVEDDFLAAIEMETALVEAGYQIAGVANRAEDAVRLAKAETPTLAIMDIRLIGKADGVDAALEIFRETGIRCIFATAHYDAHMRSRAQPAAPLGWLPKPYAPRALVAQVKRALTELDGG